MADFLSRIPHDEERSVWNNFKYAKTKVSLLTIPWERISKIFESYYRIAPDEPNSIEYIIYHTLETTLSSNWLNSDICCHESWRQRMDNVSTVTAPRSPSTQDCTGFLRSTSGKTGKRPYSLSTVICKRNPGRLNNSHIPKRMGQLIWGPRNNDHGQKTTTVLTLFDNMGRNHRIFYRKTANYHSNAMVQSIRRFYHIHLTRRGTGQRFFPT